MFVVLTITRPKYPRKYPPRVPAELAPEVSLEYPLKVGRLEPLIKDPRVPP